MANKKDVELVIRAKDEAKKTLSEVASALQNLIGVQDDLSKSAARTDNLLGKLGQEFANLNKEVLGLTALGKATKELDLANAGIARLENTLKRSKGNTSDLIAGYGKAAEATRKLQRESDEARAAMKRQEEQIRVTQMLLKNLDWGKANPSKDVLKNSLREQKEELRGLKDSLKIADTALAASQAQQAKLRSAAVEASQSLSKQRSELGQLKSEMAAVSSTVQQASRAFGGVPLTQEAIAAAAARATSGLDKVTDALRRQQSAANTTATDTGAASQATAAYRAQVQAVRQAQSAWREAQVESTKLAQSIKSAAQPNRDLQVAFTLSQAASKTAKQEYLQQAQALNQLRGVAQGSYAVFEQRARVIQAAAAAERATIVSQSAAAASGVRLREGLRGLSSATAEATARQNGLNASLGGFNSNGRQALSLAQRLRAEMLSLAASFVGLYSAINQVGSVVTAFQSLEAVQNRLGAVFDQNLDKVSSEVEFLRKEAIRLGVSFDVLGDSYSKLAVSTKEANFTQEQTRKLFLSVAEAGRVNKLSLDNMRGIFLALEQMISKGSVQSEELKRQLGDRLPGALNIFAAGLGKSTAEIYEMMKAGEILADSETMLKFADQLNKRFGGQLPSSLQSLSSQIGRFQALLNEMRIRVAEAGFADELRTALERLNAALQSGDFQGVIQAISNALVGMVRVVAFAVENIGLLVSVLKAVVVIKVAQALLGMVSSLATLNRELVRAAIQAKLTGTGLAGMAGTAVIAQVKTLTASIAAMRLQLAATPASAVASQAALRAMIGLSLGLRGALISLAGGFRLLFAAMGGIPGILISIGLAVASTFLGDLMTQVDGATEALQRHDEMLQEIKAGYAEVASGAKEWSDVLKDASEVELRNNLVRLKQELQKLRDDASEPWFQFGSNTIRTNNAFKQIREDFQAGKVSAVEFRQAIEDIAKADDTLELSVVEDMIALAKSAIEVEAAIGSTEAQMAILSDTTDETAQATLKLNESVDSLNESFANDAGKKYEQTLKGIKEMIPEMAEEFRRLEQQAKLDGLVKQLMEVGPLTKDAMDAIAKARTAIDVEAFSKSNGMSSLERTVELLQKFEGFSSKAYWDVNAFRAGYGSDTVTLDDGSIKKITEGMSVSQTDALRDLVRRIGEFQDVVKSQVGSERFEAFTAEQQAALTSIAYNYGELPARIVEAVREGSAEEIAAAVRGLKTDNGGVNAGRREAEAQILQAGSAQLTLQLAEAERERAAQAAKYLETIKAANAERTFEVENLANEARQQEINKALREADLQAKKEGVDLTSKEYQLQRQMIAETVGKRFDALNKDKLAAEERRKVEEAVNVLLERRKLLQEQIEFQENQGNAQGAENLKIQLEETNKQLELAIQNAVQFWSKVGGSEADNAILKLQSTQNEISAIGQKSIISGQQVNDMLVGNLSSAFDKFAQAIAAGENAWDSFRDAFLQAASDFLREIAQMIIKQALLNALTGGSGAASGSGGVGGFISGIIGSLFHDGGIAGSGTRTRAVSPAWFSNAMRYHTGGIAGIRPDEVPAILQKGEEILTKDDPRHIMNGGGGASMPQNIKIVNAIDPASFISEGLNSIAGEKALLNHVRANQGAYKAALGV